MVQMRMYLVSLNNYSLLDVLRINVESFSEEPLINSWVDKFPFYDAWYERTYTGLTPKSFMGINRSIT